MRNILNYLKRIFERFKRGKFGLRVKIIVPTIILILLGFLVVSTAGYIRLKNNVNSLGSAYSGTLAELAATVIHGDHVKSIGIKSEIGSPLYLKVAEQISSLMSHEEYQNIAVIGKDAKSGDFYYIYDTDNPSALGQVLIDDLDMIEAAFAGEVISSKEMEIYKYLNGETVNILYAFAPIKDTLGNNIGVVEIDFNADEVSHNLWKARVERTGMLILYPFLILLTLLSIIIAVIKNIRKINNSLEEILHNNGDLTQRIDIKSKDEIRSISKKLNELFRRLNNTMVDVRDAAENLTLTTEELNNLSTDTQDGITFISASLQEISATMEVIEDTVKAVEISIDDAYNVSNQISEVSIEKANQAKEILKKVENTYEESLISKEKALNYASDITRKVNDKIEDSRSVKEIQQLTEAVLSIALQTRLLSLNASIEAARVGDAGRGFAVVAQEIGKLAEQSAKAASSIQKVSKDVISAVDALADESSNLIEFSKGITEEGYGKLLNLASEYKENMSEISNQLNEFAENSSFLNKEMSEVKESIDIVVMSVEDTNNAITDVNTNLVKVSEDSVKVNGQSQSIGKDAELLVGNVNKFTLGEKEEEQL